MKYPEIGNGASQVFVEMRLKGQSNWRKGMFYWNGSKPCFASYGSVVTEKVEEWRYALGKSRNL